MRNAISRENKNRDNLRKFAAHIVNFAKMRIEKESNDLVSIITTNWDIMLDNELYRLIEENRESLGILDYTCSFSSIQKNDKTIKSGQYVIGKGGYNVKLLKLHGSLNWLTCPRCSIIYVKFYRKWNGGFVSQDLSCWKCANNYIEEKTTPTQLESKLIMPTYLKNINDGQLKTIWQNSGIELAEASKVVFLGYSLPQADFEFKQLLSRMIRSDAKIETVLVESDNPHNYKEHHKIKTAGFRYQSFFSKRDLTITYGGIDGYISKLRV